MHEQNRSDRDGFITINWGNIRPGNLCIGSVLWRDTINWFITTGTQANFEKTSAVVTNPFGVEYDYGSVMHYSANAFSKNGQPTIQAKVIDPMQISRFPNVASILLAAQK